MKKGRADLPHGVKILDIHNLLTSPTNTDKMEEIHIGMLKKSSQKHGDRPKAVFRVFGCSFFCLKGSFSG